MNLRFKTYLLLIPPTLLLGGLYLVSLLLFNRRDAYHSAHSQIEDRTSIIEAFIESENPQTIESLSAYLDTNLSESKERLLKNSTDFEIQIRDSRTQSVLYSWTQNLDAEDQHSTLSRINHHYSAIRSLKLDAFDPPLDLVFIAEHPFHVFLDRNFWTDVALILILLIFLGGLLSEIVVRVIKRGLSGVDIDATKLVDFPDLKSKQKGSKIQELDELSNSINTLFDSYEAKRAEKEALLSNPQPILEPSHYLEQIRKYSQASNSITLENSDCTLWKNEPDSPAYVAFLLQHELKGFAFVGLLNHNSSGFEAGIVENIVMDTIRQSFRQADAEPLPPQMELLRLFQRWTLLEICPKKRIVREYSSEDTSSSPKETVFEKDAKHVIPIGCCLSSPISQAILSSNDWKNLVRRLFENHPESAVLCIEL